MGNATNENADELLTVDEVADILKVQPKTISNWVSSCAEI